MSIHVSLELKDHHAYYNSGNKRKGIKVKHQEECI